MLRAIRMGFGMAIIAGATPCHYFVRTVPVVLLNDGTNTIRLEVSAGPGATSVDWKPLTGAPFTVGGLRLCTSGPQTITLRDDGANGDLQAGDGIFTIDNVQFDPAPACRVVGLLAESNGAMSGFYEYNIGTIAISTAGGDTTLTLGRRLLHAFGRRRSSNVPRARCGDTDRFKRAEDCMDREYPRRLSAYRTGYG